MKNLRKEKPMKSSHTTKAEFLCLVSTLIGLAVLLSSMKAVLVELGLMMKLGLAMELGSAVRWRTRLVSIG